MVFLRPIVISRKPFLSYNRCWNLQTDSHSNYETAALSWSFWRMFRRRHHKLLRFALSLRHQAVRFQYICLVSLTSHFSTLQVLMDIHYLAADRIFSLDEVWVCFGFEVDFGDGRRCLLPRNVHSMESDMRHYSKTYHNRVTMIHVVFVAGDMGPTLFVFQGYKLFNRNLFREGGF